MPVIVRDTVIFIDSADKAQSLKYASGSGPVDATAWERHQPMLHCVAMRDNLCVARCSAWADEAPRLEGQSIGVVGHYSAIDADAGLAVLAHAEAALAERGRRVLVGPMDRNTWNSYRFVTRRGDEPPFFLEPNQPDEWNEHFTAFGFKPLSTYFSALNDDLSIIDPRVASALSRFEADGGSLRYIDLGRYEDELRTVHALSVDAFGKNLLYTPISLEQFLSMYAPLRDHIRPEIVIFAERRGELQGFLFGTPDLLELRRGEPPRTAIAKSMAVCAGRQGAGLGSVLMDTFQQCARRAGFSRVIHALMQEQNTSRAISARFGRTMREYTLYAKGIGR